MTLAEASIGTYQISCVKDIDLVIKGFIPGKIINVISLNMLIGIDNLRFALCSETARRIEISENFPGIEWID